MIENASNSVDNLRLAAALTLAKAGGWVYFIQREDGPVKIGYSKMPPRRLDALQTAMPELLTLLAIIPGNPYSERQWQDRFRHLHIRGEWFRPGDDLVAAIDALYRPSP